MQTRIRMLYGKDGHLPAQSLQSLHEILSAAQAFRILLRYKIFHGDYKDSVVYCREDAAEKFLECMEQEIRGIAKIYA